MAIDTTNKKLAVMEWDNVWEPALPVSPGGLGQDDKQQLLWGYPGILWSSIAGFVFSAATITGPGYYATVTGAGVAAEIEGPGITAAIRGN